jgi:hypothetical protein
MWSIFSLALAQIPLWLMLKVFHIIRFWTYLAKMSILTPLPRPQMRPKEVEEEVKLTLEFFVHNANDKPLPSCLSKIEFYVWSAEKEKRTFYINFNVFPLSLSWVSCRYFLMLKIHSRNL